MTSQPTKRGLQHTGKKEAEYSYIQLGFPGGKVNNPSIIWIV